MVEGNVEVSGQPLLLLALEATFFAAVHVHIGYSEVKWRDVDVRKTAREAKAYGRKSHIS